jgi:hypothetical protein
MTFLLIPNGICTKESSPVNWVFAAVFEPFAPHEIAHRDIIRYAAPWLVSSCDLLQLFGKVTGYYFVRIKRENPLVPN